MSASASTSTPSTLAAGSSAETQAAAFASDPRIHFDTQSQTWKFEDDNGDELEYDAGKGAWVPVVSTSLSVLRSSHHGFFLPPHFLPLCCMAFLGGQDFV